MTGWPSGFWKDLLRMQRYAIYWAPQTDSPLAAFGRQWLGSDPERGAAVAERETYGLDADLIERATVAPRRYGLHATMKAPFRPAPGVSAAMLNEALAAFCAPRRQVRTGPLRLARFVHWLALVPTAPLADLEWLASECVVHFDRYRAPLDANDRARRQGISDPLRQSYFEQFGYPDVLTAFTFHITLAGPIPEPELDRVEAALQPAVTRFTEAPFLLPDLCCFGDPGGGALFRLCGRAPLMR
jgi:hypothetical protein